MHLFNENNLKMDNKFSLSITPTNEASYKAINYPNINSLSIISSKNKDRIENKTSQKLLFELCNQNSSMNNKKEFLIDEDDTKNNENFKIFLDNLLNKEESVINLDNQNFANNDNSSIHSNKNFFLKKIYSKNNKYIFNNIEKKEEDIYSFRDKKLKDKSSNKIINNFCPIQYKLKNFFSSIPENSKKQMIYDDNKNNINNLDINKNNYDSNKNILQSFYSEKKNVGIDCKMKDYFLIKTKNGNNINNNDIIKLPQNLSLKQFDGRMLNKLSYIGNINKKSKKNKNNSFNHIKKYIPEKIPKIIFYSRNKYREEKKVQQRLNTMKENAIHFLKDKSQNSLTSKISFITCHNNTNEKNGLNINTDDTSIFYKEINNLNEKFRLTYSNERNLMPYLKAFEKNYKKKLIKKRLNINNKKNIKHLFTLFNNKNNYEINKKSVTINNIK